VTDSAATPAATLTLSTPEETVTEGAILAFAREFDPQPYHLDRSAAATSIFGGLCASGWQICCLLTARLTEALLERGHAAVQESVRELRFRRPVFCEDRVHVSARLTPLDGGRALAHAEVRRDDGVAVITAEIVFGGVRLEAGDADA
jgi:acyl dehydratase